MMSTTKKKCTIYLDPDIEEWYLKLPPGQGTRIINEILRRHNQQIKSDNLRLQQHEELINEVVVVLARRGLFP